MRYTVFYSWQSDAPNGTNRSFIRSALEAAVATLVDSPALEDAPRVDSGMEGVSGSPEVATVMFDKIRESALMVADVTLVGCIPQEGGALKRCPNPNVLLELGYAASTLGWSRVITVMNEHFGAPQEQPFDVRNRRFPITYRLAPEASASREAEKANLATTLAGAIRVAIDADYRAAESAFARLDGNCRNLIKAHHTKDVFADADSRTFTMGGQLDTTRFGAAVTRMLDLGLIRAIVHPASKEAGYEWTFLGRAVIREFARARS